MKSSTFDMNLTAMLIALVLVTPLTFNFRLPIVANGGLVHLETATFFIAAILFGPKKEVLAGAIGMELFHYYLIGHCGPPLPLWLEACKAI